MHSVKYRLLPLVILIFLCSCSFEYGNRDEEENTKPELIMRDVDYVRVRNGDPVVRFLADYAERYEKRQLMNLENLSFLQYENNWDEINIQGNAGKAMIELESGNIDLSGGVFISVDSEDITIQTSALKWLDKEGNISGPVSGIVEIQSSDGSKFAGVGFSADSRYRTWVFESGVSGVFVEEETE